ncbi:MAG TPA: carboxypeptidase regulatory-like domain-containing protein, partial [Kofleriaceae bacterium]|nr:carboxypeptidase regulatory-like domain-containing protein [Kofleriaceae bacterium]
SMGGAAGEALEPSDPDGAFEIPGMRPGSYMMAAGAEGSMIEIGKSVQVVDKDVTDVIVELSSGVTLSGRVEPAAVAELGLEMEGEVGIANMFEMVKSAMCRGTSDASGAFTLKNAPSGSFKLVARTKEGRTGKLPITIAKTDLGGLVVTITPRASIAGRVVDTNGKPVAGIGVNAHPDEDKPRSFSMSMGDMREGATSAADGSFKIVGLDAGKYEVRARNRDDFMAMMRKDKDKKKVIVELAEGAEKTGVVVTVEARDGVIRGVVMGADHKPAADSWVTARMEPDKDDEIAKKMPERFMWLGQSEPVLTNGEGAFTIGRLKKGKYTLIAEGPKGNSHGEKAGVATGDSATIQLARLGTLTLTVKQAGKPVPAYDASCDGPGDDVQRHVAAEDGSYQFDHLAPGDYTCNVRSDTGTAEGKVTVPADDVKLDLTLTPWGSLTGVVVSVLDGKPIPGLTVAAMGGANDPTAMFDVLKGGGAKTDPTGRFVVEHVATGKGRVLFIPKDGAFQNMDSHDYEAKAGQRTDLGTIKIVPPRNGDAGTFGLSTEVDGETLKVTSVKEGGPAAGAGVQEGDKITAIAGQPLDKLGVEIGHKLLESGGPSPGQTVSITLQRGPTVTLTAIKW